jgi:hypothetical protein
MLIGFGLALQEVLFGEANDAGKTLQALWHDELILNVGSLAVDAHQPDVVYCSTGEANLSAESYPVVGIYKTGDGGQTRNLLANSDSAGIPRGKSGS